MTSVTSHFRYPRFLLHHSQKQSSKGRTRPHTSLGINLQSCPVNYPRVQTPLLPLKTPTFYRVPRRYEQKSGAGSREYAHSQRSTRPNSSRGRNSHLHHGFDEGDKSFLELGSGSSQEVEKWRSSRRMVTKGSITDCNVSKKSSIIFQRDTSKCSSLPYLHDNKRYVSDSTLSNKSRSYLEPLKQHKNGDTYAMLPQSIRQTYTPSPIPSLQQDTSADCHVPPTGSSGYHRLTGYTARHLPNPTSSRTVTTFVVYIHEYA